VSNDDIKDLIQIFIESGVAEMEIRRGENSLRLRRNFGPPPTTEVVIPHMMTQAAPGAVANSQTPALQSAPSATGAQPAPQPLANADTIVKSPIVGTYYDSPKPGDPPFVKVGDQVEPGQVLCIIESMKLMNEIESEVAGTIAAKLMESGRPVEYGEALFAIRPR
jgi:acetyl-CoA carboxylase biotin carboxyl carrier protein